MNTKTVYKEESFSRARTASSRRVFGVWQMAALTLTCSSSAWRVNSSQPQWRVPACVAQANHPTEWTDQDAGGVNGRETAVVGVRSMTMLDGA